MTNFVKKPSYVCSTCGQDFTRKANAKRHNQNIHSDKGIIVTFMEYLVRRLSGMYQPADPLSYRIKNKYKAKDKIVHENGIKTFPESVLSSVKRHTNARAQRKQNIQ